MHLDLMCQTLRTNARKCDGEGKHGVKTQKRNKIILNVSSYARLYEKKYHFVAEANN